MANGPDVPGNGQIVDGITRRTTVLALFGPLVPFWSQAGKACDARPNPVHGLFNSIDTLRHAEPSHLTVALVGATGVPDGRFYWKTAEGPYRDDGANVVTPNRAAGAWVRQSADSIAFSARGLGAVARTLEDKVQEVVSVKDFGAKGDGSADDYDAIVLAREAANARGAQLMFPNGTYMHSKPLNFGLARLRVFGQGRVVLNYTGSGPVCVSCDPGEANVIYNNSIENITVRGSGAPRQVGFLSRNIAHGVRRNIRVRNVTDAAFDIRGDIATIYDCCVVSQLDDGADDAYPDYNFRLTSTSANSTATACLFTNCLAEWSKVAGIYLERAAANKWVGGSSEGNDGLALLVASGSYFNAFDSLFMEYNKRGDVLCEGSGNRFASCTASTSREGLSSIRLTAKAQNNVVSGAHSPGPAESIHLIDIMAGATNNRIENLHCHRIVDQGTATVIDNVKQAFVSATQFASRTFGNQKDPNPKAFDWYEEGTATPVIRGGTSPGEVRLDVRSTRWTRVGNIVHYHVLVRVLSSGTAAGDTLIFPGIPHPARPDPIPATLGRCDLVTLPPGATQFAAHFVSGDRIILGALKSGGSFIGIGVKSLPQGAVLSLSGSYEAV